MRVTHPEPAPKSSNNAGVHDLRSCRLPGNAGHIKVKGAADAANRVFKGTGLLSTSLSHHNEPCPHEFVGMQPVGRSLAEVFSARACTPACSWHRDPPVRHCHNGSQMCRKGSLSTSSDDGDVSMAETALTHSRPHRD